MTGIEGPVSHTPCAGSNSSIEGSERNEEWEPARGVWNNQTPEAGDRARVAILVGDLDVSGLRGDAGEPGADRGEWG